MVEFLKKYGKFAVFFIYKGINNETKAVDECKKKITINTIGKKIF